MDKEIIQPEINIGLIGHVDHGKTTLLEKLSGKWADIHSEEIKRGITIKLGYADVSFYYCKKCKKYSKDRKCRKCKEEGKLIRKVSFVDAPGHEMLMATMLSGAAIMDAAILMVSADEKCPQPQTEEHLKALEIIGINNIIIVQNKIDLVDEKEALDNYNDIKEFVKGTIAEKSPIIPISAKQEINIDVLIKEIVERFKVPKRDLKKNAVMFIARSFDINKPGIPIKDLRGGVLGGAIKYGVLKKGDEVTIRPGVKRNNKWQEIKTKIIDIKTGGTSVKEAVAGGSIALLTSLDPSIVKSDGLSGNLLGKDLPENRKELKLDIKLMEKVAGTKEHEKIDPIRKNEFLMVNVNSSITLGRVTDISKKGAILELKRPVCALLDDRFAISRKIGNRWRLVGFGTLIE